MVIVNVVMMVYNKYGLVFVAIPKCLTTSIHQTLQTNSDSHQDGHAHYSVSTLIEMYGNSLLSNYLSFTIVRNPYDRIWSAWKHLSLEDQYIGELDMVDRFRNFVKEELPLQFSEHVRKFDHYKPQVDYIYAMRRHCMVDKIIRFENLNNEWESFRLWYRNNTSGDVELPNSIGISNETVKIKEDPYDDESREIIKRFYKYDFKLLGYDE